MAFEFDKVMEDSRKALERAMDSYKKIEDKVARDNCVQLNIAISELSFAILDLNKRLKVVERETNKYRLS